MNHTLRLIGLCLAALAPLAQGTTLQRLSFEELTDTSDIIVAGEVTRTWTAWDAGHHYIWTHYEVAVSSAQKGAPAKSVELAEPGGVAEGMGMSIAGSVNYKVGDTVMVFLKKMPNGMIRTAGWGQGKYTVDSQGRLHGDSAPKGVGFIEAKTAVASATPLTALEGMSVEEAGSRIAARMRATQRNGKVQ